jgi:mono/diheme cytochrome c family protein
MGCEDFVKRLGVHLLATLASVALAAALSAQAPANDGAQQNGAEKNNSSGKKNGAERKSAAAPSAEEIERGKLVYNKRCAVCHFPASDAKKVGPGLKSISKRSTYESDGKPVNDASLRAWIEDGGKNMPAFKAVLNADQVRDLLAYLKSL